MNIPRGVGAVIAGGFGIFLACAGPLVQNSIAASASRVIATVNGQPIFFADFQKELRTAIDYWRKQSPETMDDPANLQKVRESTLEQLIDREILLQEGNRKGVAAGEAELDSAVAEIRSRFGSESEFKAQLSEEGLTTQQFRDRLGKQVAVRKLLNIAVRPDSKDHEKKVSGYVAGLRAAADIQRDLEQRGTLMAAIEKSDPSPEDARKASDVDNPSYQRKARLSDYALVIGIEKYKALPAAQYAEHDAATVRKHLLALGYPQRNIIFLSGEDATKSKIQAYLEEWLPKNMKVGSNLFVYYSGHGAPDPETAQGYIVPWDGDPVFLKSTAFSLKAFYGLLNKLPSKRIVVALDSCFSGAGGRSVLAKGARPLVAVVDQSAASGKVILLTAASGTQISGGFDDQAHGIFTYYLLKGIAGEAKDSSGAVTPKALFDYLSPLVQDEARRQNREQTPMLMGDGTTSPL